MRISKTISSPLLSPTRFLRDPQIHTADEYYCHVQLEYSRLLWLLQSGGRQVKQAKPFEYQNVMYTTIGVYDTYEWS